VAGTKKAARTWGTRARVNKTQPTAASVDAFVASIEDDGRRRDTQAVLRLMNRVTRIRPRMWGPSIVGFGSYRYRFANGGDGHAPLIGFSPRKRELTLYVLDDFPRCRPLLDKLGKHTVGKSCLYIKRLADVDLDVLEELVAASFDHQKATRDATLA
jgi:hypothetical protein